MSEQSNAPPEADQPSPPPKSVLSESMEQSHAVRAYLSAWDSQTSRSRQSPDEMRASVARLKDKIAEATPILKIQMIQKRRDIEIRLETFESVPDITDVGSRFVEVVKAYSEGKGIDYETWREYGIPASVLKQGGMRPRRRKTT